MNPSNLPKSNPALTRSKSNGAAAESVDVQAGGGKSGSIGNVVTKNKRTLHNSHSNEKYEKWFNSEREDHYLTYSVI